MKKLLGFLVWCVLRAYVWLARKPEVTFNDPESGRPYLRRWPIVTRGAWPDAEGRTGGEGWYLHKFLASDHARELHNHPSAYAVAYVLRGGYFEDRRQTDGAAHVACRWFGPGAMNVITGATFHRVTLPAAYRTPDPRYHLAVGRWYERPSWSLFYIGPRSGNGWGFLQPDGTVRRAPHNNGHTGEIVARDNERVS